MHQPWPACGSLPPEQGGGVLIYDVIYQNCQRRLKTFFKPKRCHLPFLHHQFDDMCQRLDLGNALGDLEASGIDSNELFVGNNGLLVSGVTLLTNPHNQRLNANDTRLQISALHQVLGWKQCSSAMGCEKSNQLLQVNWPRGGKPKKERKSMGPEKTNQLLQVNWHRGEKQKK